MGTLAAGEKFLRKISFHFRKCVFFLGELRDVRRKRRLYAGVRLTRAQRKEIQDFYTKYYGKKIPTAWHRLYQSYTGVFRYDYIPEILFCTLYEPKANPYRRAEFLEDKNILPLVFSGLEENGIRVPRVLLSCIEGDLRGADGRALTESAAVDLLKAVHEKAVFKKSVYTNSGKDVRIAVPADTDLEKLLGSLGKNYIVQEYIQQCAELRKLNPSSVNTFRVPTYRLDGRIYNAPVSLRLGRSGADRDNIHYGGIGIGVREDGSLKKTAFTEFGQRFDAHPDTGVVFEGYRIPGAGERLRAAARLLHEKVPFLGVISWDLTIDSDGMITLIELNAAGQSAGLPQRVNGEPFFGENTARVLESLRI